MGPIRSETDFALLDLRKSPSPDHLQQFIVLFNRNFTDPSQREDPELWSARLRDRSCSPYTHLLVVLAPVSAGTRPVIGGIVFEYYPLSRCSLLTYLAVDEKYRQPRPRTSPHQECD
jgi:hypothetical protein